MIYAPTKILDYKNCSDYIQTFSVNLDKNEYLVVSINGGRVFTDRLTNITFISRKYLCPCVSWQYLGTYLSSNGLERKILSDHENFVLNRKILIDCFPTKINSTVISLLTGGAANNNYFHWLFDTLPRIYMVKVAIDKLDDHVKYLIPEDTQPFQRESLEAIGIPSSLRITSKVHRHVCAIKIIATTHPHPNIDEVQSWVVKFLRKSFLKLSANSQKVDLIYISRTDSLHVRKLLNEDYFFKLLKPIGFQIYRLSKLTFSEQVSLFSNAKMIVGVHGAGLANLVFSPSQTVVYELFSTCYQPSMYERLSELVGLDYRKIVCQANENYGSEQKTSFYIAENDIYAIVKSAQKIIGKQK
ncbi:MULTISPECIES: DUF563 domain-containing protein [Cyanophyceae]|nr:MULTISPECIES: glycosyltransferase family 61 protein [Cyanophyceae]SMH34446.1 Protein of unknown function [Picosynechococcus sp. OG1]